MIQRIQSIYLLISIVCLSLVSFGVSIFSFETPDGFLTFTAYGLEKFDKTHVTSYPFFLLTFILILMCFLTLFTYKNLSRQLRLGKLVFLVYLLLILALTAFLCWGVIQPHTNRKLGIGFFLFIVGLPFVFLANKGIKKDKNLLDSLNRLR